MELANGRERVSAVHHERRHVRRLARDDELLAHRPRASNRRAAHELRIDPDDVRAAVGGDVERVHYVLYESTELAHSALRRHSNQGLDSAVGELDEVVRTDRAHGAREKMLASNLLLLVDGGRFASNHLDPVEQYG